MNKVKTIITAALFFAAIQVFALDFYPQKYIQNPSAAEKKVKWSTMDWGNSHDFETNMPKGFKPGPFDGVHMRHYGQTVTVDQDISIGTLGIGGGGGLFEATKRNIKVRYNIHMPTAVGKNRMRLDNCTLEVGRFWEFWVPEGGFDQAVVDLINTTATVKGDLYSIFYNVGADYKINHPCGPRINLTGKTVFSIAGVILDDFYRAQPNLTFKFTFTEKNGDVPMLKVTKRTDLKDCTFDLVLTSSVKPGRHPIIFHENRQSPADYPHFMVNGSRHTIGDEISVGGKTAVLEFEGKDRNSQEKNCLVLVVK